MFSASNTQSAAVLRKSGGAGRVGFGSETVAGHLTRNSAPSKRYTARELDKPAETGILSLALQSILNRKPTIAPIVDEKVARAMSADYCSIVPAVTRGAGNGGFVFGGFLGANGQGTGGVFLLLAPLRGSVVGNYTFTVEAYAIDGSDLDDLTVSYGSWKSEREGMSQIGVRYDISRSGNTWTVVAPISTYIVGDMIGLQIHTPDTVNNYEIAGVSIQNPDGEVFTLSDYQKRDLVINLSAGESTKTVYVQHFPDSVEVRSIGVKSGKVPSRIWVSPTADATTSERESNIAAKSSPWLNENIGCIPIVGSFVAEAYYRNGYDIPAVIFHPGIYENRATSDRPHIRPYDTNIFDRPSEWIYACPFGQAVLTGSPTRKDGVILGAQPDNVTPTYYIKNIHCDETITRPWRVIGVTAYLLNVSCQYSAAEGIDIDDCNVFIENGDFAGAVNDGVNSHGWGHTVLIDCAAHNNEDDGFSPHDDCTYEVWGGSYYENGKGNIIPAFGAKGFCVDVDALDSTGLSTRNADLAGANDGGFVSLSDNRGSPTTLFVVRGSSEGNTHGILSAGKNALAFCCATRVANNVTSDITCINWSSSSGNSGQTGKCLTTFIDIDAATVTDANQRLTAFKGNVLDET
jgi:hypothetical protein